MLIHKVDIKLVHFIVFTYNSQAVGCRDKRYLGDSAVERRLSFTEMQKIMSSERNRIHFFSAFKAFKIDSVKSVVAGVNQLGFNIANLLIDTEAVLPHHASEMFY